jgi:type VI secretion system secreted protein VgrG
MASEANVSHSGLKISGLPPNCLRILRVNARESVSSCFNYEVLARGEGPPLEEADLIGQKACLEFYFKGRTLCRYGVIVSFDRMPAQGVGGGFYQQYTFIVRPRLYLQGLGSQSRVFSKMSSEQIISQVLDLEGFSISDYTIDLSTPLPLRDFTVQYNESNLNFVQRLMEDEGIYYYFDHSGFSEKLCITDTGSRSPHIPHDWEIPFIPVGGMATHDYETIMRAQRQTTITAGGVKIKGYHYRTPETNIIGTATGPGQGEYYEFNHRVLNTNEANRAAALKRETLAAGKVKITGQSDCRSLYPGHLFKITGSVEAGIEGEYMITSVTHNVEQAPGSNTEEGKADYVNTFIGVPAGSAYHTPSTARIPQISGILVAKANGPKGEYAFLDESGRYRVKYPFDLEPTSGGNASQPIRLAQPYSGPNYGIHFPNHQSSDLVLAFEGGDVDKPIALGVCPNPSMASPVNNRNKSQALIRTASGHQLCFEDFAGKTAVDLVTAGGHQLSMKDKEEEQGIELKSSDDNSLLLSDAGQRALLRTAEGKNFLNLSNKDKCITLQTDYGHVIKLDDKAGSISIQTGNGHMLSLDDKKKTITLKDKNGKHVLQMDISGGGLTVTTQGDINFKAKGSFNVDAKDISLKAGQGPINIKAMKDLNAEGMNLNLKAKQKAQLQGGMDVSIKGNMNLKLEGGMKVESKAGLSQKITGTMVNVEASGINTIKGAMVMIN